MTKSHPHHATEADREWHAPGPGTWELDTTHFGPECSRLSRDVIEAGSNLGFLDGLTRLGAPIRSIAMRFVNGRMFMRLVPLIAAERNLPPPPGPILWAVTRLHPEFRRRNKRAAEALDSRIWMDDHARWEAEWKPSLITQNTKFGAVDLEGLSNEKLAAHIDALYGHCVESAALHFKLHVSDLGPLGRLLVAGSELELDSALMMKAMAGASPATTEPIEALAGLRGLVAASGATPTTLDEIRSISTDASRALDDYLHTYGDRLTGYDVKDVTLGELPHMIVATVLEPPAGQAQRITQAGDDSAAELLAQVPDADRADLQLMLDDARALYGLRDENGPLTFEWPMGLMRKAVLETQRRLLSAGQLAEPEAVFDLQASEMSALLRGESMPSVTEIASRTSARRTWPDLDAPNHLGPAPIEPPVAMLPGALRRLMEVVLLVTSHIDASGDDAPLCGTGIGQEPYVGRACVVLDANEAFENMEPGDVLITPFTAPTFNAVLGIAGAVVTEYGGMLCHAAVMAREFGIAGVVGAANATTEIPNGAQVEVNPLTGVVKVLEVAVVQNAG